MDTMDTDIPIYLTEHGLIALKYERGLGCSPGLAQSLATDAHYLVKDQICGEPGPRNMG